MYRYCNGKYLCATHLHIPPGGLRGLPGLRPQGAGRHPLGAVLRGATAITVPPGGGCPGGAGREGSFEGDGMWDDVG